MTDNNHSPLIQLDGFDITTGQPLFEPIAPMEVGRNLFERAVKEKSRPFTPKTLGAKDFGVERGLFQAWGLVCKPNLDKATLAALQPLIDHRRGKIYPYKGEQDITTWEKSLTEQGLSLRTSMYLLLIGPPTEIPFEFEKMLTPPHIVGRLSLPNPEAYARYAQHVLAYETDQKAILLRRQEAEFFAPDDNKAAALSAQSLVSPLIETINADPDLVIKCRGWVGGSATREKVTARLGEYQEIGAPALVFMASHGAEVSPELQSKYQGSWTPQGAQALGKKYTAKQLRDGYITGLDFESGELSPRGAVVFNYSCFGAGLHNEFTLRRWMLFDEIIADDPNPLVSALGQSLLGNSRPALAYISALDRTGNVFSWPGGFNVILECLQLLLTGYPIGDAIASFWLRSPALENSAENLLTDLLQQVKKISALPEEQAYNLGLNWWLAEVLTILYYWEIQPPGFTHKGSREKDHERTATY